MRMRSIPSSQDSLPQHLGGFSAGATKVRWRLWRAIPLCGQGPAVLVSPGSRVTPRAAATAWGHPGEGAGLAPSGGLRPRGVKVGLQPLDLSKSFIAVPAFSGANGAPQTLPCPQPTLAVPTNPPNPAKPPNLPGCPHKPRGSPATLLQDKGNVTHIPRVHPLDLSKSFIPIPALPGGNRAPQTLPCPQPTLAVPTIPVAAQPLSCRTRGR